VPGRSVLHLIVGDSAFVPFQAIAGDIWQEQLAGADLEWARQHRMVELSLAQSGPILVSSAWSR
jgi:hypothetical protein